MHRNLRALILTSLVISGILFAGLTIRIENVNAGVLVVTVMTEISVYNPGDTVPVRVHVVTSIGDPVNDAQVNVMIESPDGAIIAAGQANLFGAPGWYTFQHMLAPSGGGGVYKVSAQASRPGDTSGSAQTTFTVTGTPVGKVVDWAVFNPSATPANPTTEDPVTLNVWLKIVAQISAGPYSIDVICSVDGVLVGGGTLSMSGATPQTMVYTPAKKYSAGTHTATWVADPDSEYSDNNRSNNVVSFQFTVTPPAPAFDFSLTTSPPSQTIRAGQTTSFTITATLTSGASKSISLKVDGLPSGASHTLSPSSGNPTFTSTFSIQTSESTPLGTYTLTIGGEGEGLTKTATVALIIEASLERDFAISVSPTSQKIHPSQSTTYSIGISPVNEFDSTVTLTVVDRPSGVSANFNPPAGKPPFTSILTIDTVDSVAVGSFVLTVTASGGEKTHTTTIVLVLEATEETSTTAAPSIWEQIPGGQTTIIAVLAIILIAVIAAALSRRGRRTPAPPPIATKRCIKCGTELPVTSVFCSNCGERV